MGSDISTPAGGARSSSGASALARQQYVFARKWLHGPDRHSVGSFAPEFPCRLLFDYSPLPHRCAGSFAHACTELEAPPWHTASAPSHPQPMDPCAAGWLEPPHRPLLLRRRLARAAPPPAAFAPQASSSRATARCFAPQASSSRPTANCFAPQASLRADAPAVLTMCATRSAMHASLHMSTACERAPIGPPCGRCLRAPRRYPHLDTHLDNPCHVTRLHAATSRPSLPHESACIVRKL